MTVRRSRAAPALARHRPAPTADLPIVARKTSKTLRTVLAAALLVAAYRYVVAPRLAQRGLGTWGPAVPATDTDHLRVVVWNVENFGDDRDRVENVVATLRDLDPAVAALVEVRDPAALRRALPDRRVIVSKRGGRGRQRLAFVVDERRAEILGEPVEHAALAMGGRVRPGFAVRVRGRPRGPDFHLALVHLKAMPQGAGLRRRQWRVLRRWVEALDDDRDLLLVGDFNPVGDGRASGSEDELSDLARTMAAAGLSLHTPPGACSAYWEGPRRDAWKEPSLLDLVFVRDLAEAVPSDDPLVRVAGACARTGCGRLRSTRARPDPFFAQTSDHCPLVLDLLQADDDP